MHEQFNKLYSVAEQLRLDAQNKLQKLTGGDSVCLQLHYEENVVVSVKSQKSGEWKDYFFPKNITLEDLASKMKKETNCD